MIRIDAPAKVNLRLRVLAREESGYHSLETLFCAISLCDEITVSSGGAGISLDVAGAAPTEAPEQNLVVRAAQRFFAGAEHGPAVRIGLTKRIPAAAGLGGGSSDAAATLRALSVMYGDQDEGDGGPGLLQMSAELGSDVPFFLCGSPLALAWSRGEDLLALPPLPARPVLIGHPGRAYPTADAFRRLADARGRTFRPPPHAIRLAELQGWETIARLATNDFEAPAVEAVPELEAALGSLRRGGAFISMLAGSGAAVFGVFHSDEARDAAEPELASLGFDTWRARTLESMPEPSPRTRGGALPGRVDPSRRQE